MEVNFGDSASVSVKVSDTGSLEGKYALTLKINTVQVESRNVTLAGGAIQQIELIATSANPGTTIVEVNGLTGELFLLRPTPPPAKTTLPAKVTTSVTPTSAATQEKATGQANP